MANPNEESTNKSAEYVKTADLRPIVVQLRWYAVLIFLLSFVQMIVGILLIAIYYFDLLYRIMDNRIIEFADPLIGPVTMPLYTVLTVDAAILFVTSAIYFVYLVKIKKNRSVNAKSIETVLKVLGYGSLLLFPTGTFLGVIIINYIDLFKSKKIETISGGKQPLREPIFRDIAGVFFAYGAYRLITGIMLVASYHLLFVVPYEHLGSEYASEIKKVWAIAFYYDLFLIVDGALSVIFGVLSRTDRFGPDKLGLFATVFMIFNVWMFPIGTIVSVNLYKSSRLLGKAGDDDGVSVKEDGDGMK